MIYTIDKNLKNSLADEAKNIVKKLFCYLPLSAPQFTLFLFRWEKLEIRMTVILKFGRLCVVLHIFYE